MTLDQIMKLLDAGYTKEEIAEYKSLETGGQESNQDDKTDPEPKQDDKTDPEPRTDPEPQPEPTPAYITSLMKSIDKLTKTLQISNRNGAEGAGGTEKSADDVIKDVIGTMTGKKGDNK